MFGVCLWVGQVCLSWQFLVVLRLWTLLILGVLVYCGVSGAGGLDYCFLVGLNAVSRVWWLVWVWVLCWGLGF